MLTSVKGLNQALLSLRPSRKGAATIRALFCVLLFFPFEWMILYATPTGVLSSTFASRKNFAASSGGVGLM